MSSETIKTCDHCQGLIRPDEIYFHLEISKRGEFEYPMGRSVFIDLCNLCALTDLPDSVWELWRVFKEKGVI